MGKSGERRAQTQSRLRSKRLRLEAELLYHLWVEGALPLHRLIAAFPAQREELKQALESLLSKRYVYIIYEPVGDHDGSSSVYYLTKHIRERLSKLFQGDPRYHLQLLWYSLREEEGRSPQVTIG